MEYSNLKNHNLMKTSILIIMFVFSVTLSYATTTKFIIVPTTPTNVSVPQNHTVIVQYKITNNTARTRTLTVLPISVPGVTVLNDTLSCGNPFTLAPQGSCFQTFVLNGSQIPSSFQANIKVCKTIGNGNNQPDNLLCSQTLASDILTANVTPEVTNIGQAVYVANQAGNSISLCYTNATTGFLENCNITAANGTIATPESVATNPAGTFLYIANTSGSGGVSYCQINSTTGALTECQATGNGFPTVTGGIVIAPDNAHAYVSVFTYNSVSVCDVNSTTGALSGCTATGNSFDTPSGIAINAAGTFVYVTNRHNNSVTPCSVGGGGALTCGTPVIGFNEPEGITLLGSHAYITNAGNGTVSLCDVSGLTIDNCAITEGTFAGLGNIGFNSAGTLGYLPSSLVTVAVCDVNAITGALSNCTNAPGGTGFQSPSGIVLQTLP